MKLIEKVSELHDILKEHKFRDGKSILTADSKAIKEYCDLWHSLMHRYAQLAYYEADQDIGELEQYEDYRSDLNYYEMKKSEKKLLKIPSDKTSSVEVKQGICYLFFHDTNAGILELRYAAEEEDFATQEIGPKMVAALDFYLSQIHEYLNHKRVSRGHFMQKFRDGTFRVYQFEIDNNVMKTSKATIVLEFKLY